MTTNEIKPFKVEAYRYSCCQSRVCLKGLAKAKIEVRGVLGIGNNGWIVLKEAAFNISEKSTDEVQIGALLPEYYEHAEEIKEAMRNCPSQLFKIQEQTLDSSAKLLQEDTSTNPTD